MQRRQPCCSQYVTISLSVQQRLANAPTDICLTADSPPGKVRSFFLEVCLCGSSITAGVRPPRLLEQVPQAASHPDRCS